MAIVQQRCWTNEAGCGVFGQFRCRCGMILVTDRHEKYQHKKSKTEGPTELDSPSSQRWLLLICRTSGFFDHVFSSTSSSFFTSRPSNRWHRQQICNQGNILYEYIKRLATQKCACWCTGRFQTRVPYRLLGVSYCEYIILHYSRL